MRAHKHFVRVGVVVVGLLLAPAQAPGQPIELPAQPQTQAEPVRSENFQFRDEDTYVYLVNGLDPFHWAGLDRVGDRLRIRGYPRTTYGGYFDVPKFEREIRQRHRTNPQARVVLIGFSAGTLACRSAAGRLTRDGIPIAMLGYIGGDYLADNATSRPPGVERVVNVRGNGFLLTGRNLIWNGTDLSGATNARLSVDHFWLPMQSETLDLLLAGLHEVSAGGSR